MRNPKAQTFGIKSKSLQEGGRCSKKMLKGHAEKIREYLGLSEDEPDVHEVYQSGKTIQYGDSDNV